jgi:hypothetical protein
MNLEGVPGEYLHDSSGHVRAKGYAILPVEEQPDLD